MKARLRGQQLLLVVVELEGVLRVEALVDDGGDRLHHREGLLALEHVPAHVNAGDEAWELARHRAAVEHVLSRTAFSEQSRRIYRELIATGDNCAAVARRLGLPATTVRQVKSRVTRMISACKKSL